MLPLETVPASRIVRRPPSRLGTITCTRSVPRVEPTLRITKRMCQSPSAKQTVPLYAELPAGRRSELWSLLLPLRLNGSFPETTFAPPESVHPRLPLSKPLFRSRA